MKTCYKCEITKDVSEFPKAKRYKDGVRNECKLCYTAYMMAYYDSNPDKKAAKNALNTGRASNWKRHKLTEEQYLDMLKKYDGKCYACQDREATCIDHDHACCGGTRRSCGECIRGLLCHNCNTALGLMKDDPLALMKLVNYILSTNNP